MFFGKKKNSFMNGLAGLTPTTKDTGDIFTNFFDNSSAQVLKKELSEKKKLLNNTYDVVIAIIDFRNSSEFKQNDFDRWVHATRALHQLAEELTMDFEPRVKVIKFMGDGVFLGSKIVGTPEDQVYTYYKYIKALKLRINEFVETGLMPKLATVLGICKETYVGVPGLTSYQPERTEDFIGKDIDKCFRLEKYGLWEGIVLNHHFYNVLSNLGSEIDKIDYCTEHKRELKGYEISSETFHVLPDNLDVNSPFSNYDFPNEGRICCELRAKISNINNNGGVNE